MSTYVDSIGGVSTYVNYARDVAEPIDPDELVDATEVAAILGLSHRNSVSTYRARHADFPAPVVEKSRCVLWHRAAVEDWLRRRS